MGIQKNDKTDLFIFITGTYIYTVNPDTLNMKLVYTFFLKRLLKGLEKRLRCDFSLSLWCMPFKR